MKRDPNKDRRESETAMQRMDKALRAAMKMPPRNHKAARSGVSQVSRQNEMSPGL